MRSSSSGPRKGACVGGLHRFAQSATHALYALGGDAGHRSMHLVSVPPGQEDGGVGGVGGPGGVGGEGGPVVELSSP